MRAPLRTIEIRDDAVGLHAWLTIDSTRRGPAFGGIRRRAYASDAQAREDSARLARSMSRKCALAELAAGGAKTVVRVPPGREVDWAAAYAVLGDAIQALQGTYVAGPDVGTGPDALAVVRSRTRHVNPIDNDAAAATAAGVVAGLRAVQRVRGTATRHVVIQGLGAVGRIVAQTLKGRGVRVTGADPDEAAVAAARAIGVEIVAPADVFSVACDVFVPCAMGQILDSDVARSLPCAAVCGCANDQLADASAAEVLHARGIVHAPDIVVSAGAVIEGVFTVREGADAAVRARARAHVEAIESRLHAVLLRARELERPPSAVAIELADAALA